MFRNADSRHLTDSFSARSKTLLERTIMDNSAIGGLVVALILALGVSAAIYFTLRARKNKQERLAAMSPEEREHHDATAEYEASVNGAQKALVAEEKAREKRLAAAQKTISKAGSMGTKKLGAFKGEEGTISFTGRTITTPNGTYPLDENVTAAADTAGNLAMSSRSTLTRIAAGGLAFGPVGAIVGGVAKKSKMHDTRELYLLVEGAQFAAVLTCKPDEGQKVRQFAMSIVQASRSVKSLLAAREVAVDAALAAREAEEANTAPVEAAQRALVIAQGATSRKDAAQAQLSGIAASIEANKA